jgi:hypothetical protein
MRRQVFDHRHGGVYPIVPADLPPWYRPRLRGDRRVAKGDCWKDASHETDALLTCMGLLRTSS